MSADFFTLAANIKAWGVQLGFQKVGIAGIDLSHAEPGLLAWLNAGFHGEMDYMAKHGVKRVRPAELVPGTLRVITARMDYLPQHVIDGREVIENNAQAFIARYALGRDYHKVLRNRLQQLVEKINAGITEEHQFRVFTDSAPVMEVELAVQAGIGWRGKHTLLLDKNAGSYFFLGEIYTDIPLPIDAPTSAHCGTCAKCIEVCPTQAIVAPYRLDARRCISYLTIEHKSAIPEELRSLIGNRVYGCDDCQLFCPWNKFAQSTDEKDFAVHNGLDNATLIELFSWSATTFNDNTSGSAIHRIGYERWLRNLAVGLGNATTSNEIVNALRARADDASALVREHVAWALKRHEVN